MTWVHRIDGAPGAGKTHTLLNKIEQHREDGVPIEDMLFLTFTNAARKDAKAEISARFEDITRNEADDIVYTIHGAALGAAGTAGVVGQDDTIIQPGGDPYYNLFSERHGMNYAGTSVRDVQEGKEIEGNGDAFFALNSWLASTYRDAEDVRHAPIEFPWYDIDTFRQLQRDWEDYKRTVETEYRLWEHHDYLAAAIDNNAYPVADVIFIDEFQDFSPLQYKYYKDLRDHGSVDTIYIAGDPHQSIYSFRGADPYYFNETDYDEETELNTTRRCRDAIATLARRVLETSAGNGGRAFTAARGGGVVRTVGGTATNVEAAIDAATATASDSVMLLARTNGQWKRLARFLRKQGYPYQVLGSRGWSMWEMDKNETALAALQRLQQADYIKPGTVADLAEYLPKATVRGSGLDIDGPTGGSKIHTKTVCRKLGCSSGPVDLVDKLQLQESYRRAIRAVLNREDPPNKTQLRVGTIHASKGLEADTVLLFPSYSRQMQDRYMMDDELRAEEHRVAYVAATRARDRLYIVRDFFGSKQPMPMFETPAVREVVA